MPTDDRQVLVAGTAPTPALFTIPGNGQIRPKTIFAHYDGSGAASAFYPAIKIISDGGQTIGIYPTTFTVAAGGSAEVSWFPGLAVPTLAVQGATIQAYWGLPPAADFTWTGPAGGNVNSNFPTNNTFTKLLDSSALFINFAGDFTPGAAEDLITLGVFLNGGNRINVGSASLGGYGFMTVVGSTLRGIPGDPVAFPAGAYTITMPVSSATGQTTTFRSSTSVNMEIQELVF